MTIMMMMMMMTTILLLRSAAMPPSERKKNIILVSELHSTCHVTSIDCEMRLLVRQDFTVLEPCVQAELGGSLQPYSLGLDAAVTQRFRHFPASGK
jgi:hypothetical protein